MKNTKRYIVIVEPVSSGLALVEEAISLGLGVVVVSFDSDERYLPDKYRKLVDDIIIVDTNNEAEIFKALVDLKTRVQLDAIIPGFEYYVPIVSRINAKLNLPGLPPQSVNSLRIKSQMRERLHAHGVLIPVYTIIDSPIELEAAASLVGFPAVLKPVNFSGSIHVSRVDSIQELQKAYEAINTDLQVDLGIALSSQVQLEAYIDGPEFSIEGIVTNDGIHIVSITEKLLGLEPYFVEIGHIVEPEFSLEKRELIQVYVTDVVNALGVTLGTFHCEIRLSLDGPVVIELGARLPGDHICELVALSKGISLPRAMIESYLGQPISALEKILTPIDQFAGIRFFTAPGLSHYENVMGLQELEMKPGFVKYELTIPARESIPPLIDFRGRIGFTIFTAPTYQEIQRRLLAVDKQISFI
jgi:biotin carboxylase